jgi:hypothetical protein
LLALFSREEIDACLWVHKLLGLASPYRTLTTTTLHPYCCVLSKASGLYFIGIKIDTRWIRYGYCGNPARGVDKGCPENVLHQMKHNPGPAGNSIAALGLGTVYFYFLAQTFHSYPCLFLLSSPHPTPPISLFLLAAIFLVCAYTCLSIEYHQPKNTFH